MVFKKKKKNAVNSKCDVLINCLLQRAWNVQFSGINLTVKVDTVALTVV